MRIVFAALLAIACAFAGDRPKSPEKEIGAVIERRQAMLKGDAATLEKLYSNDLTYEHSSAKLETKPESIRNATKAGNLTKAIEFHDPSIRIYGNTAIFRSRGDFTTHTGAVNHLDVLMVWIKAGQDWQLVARQATKVQ
jgi:hypothetical protein